MRKNDLGYLAIFLILLIIVYRSLIAGITTNLPDWYDSAYVAWIIRNNLDKLFTLNISGIFDTNILFPNKNTLLLTETFFTQSFLVIPIRFFSKNPIFLFNISFLLTYVLDYSCSYIFWKKLFKARNIAFLGALLTVFSPFYHAEHGHFQIMSYWPSFVTLYFLFQNKSTKKLNYLIMAGVFLGIQFYASAYLALFLIVAIGLYFLSLLASKHNLFKLIKSYALIIGVFIIIGSPVILGYVKVQKEYHVDRKYEEYVYYSAHISDYLFSQGITSEIHSFPFIRKWNSFNQHHGGGAALFPGFIVAVLGILGYYTSKPNKNKKIFFLLLAGTGILFSLGPRMSFNGTYSPIPLPYHFILKYVPFFDLIRAPSRWMFFFYIGLIYFSIEYLSKKTIRFPIFLLLTALIIAEYVPLNIQTHKEVYILPKDRILNKLCSEEKKVVLEVPVTHFDAGKDIYSGLSYLTKTILASTYHGCYLVNGYSSYDLPSIATLKNSMYDASSAHNLEDFLSILKSSQANILVINRDFLRPEVKDDFLFMVNKSVNNKYLLPYSNDVFQIRIPSE